MNLSIITSENILFILLMGIPAYFITRFIFKKLINDERKQRILTWASTLLLAPLLYAGLVVVFFSILFHEPTCAFDQQKWNTDIESRKEMADHLVDSKTLIGKDTNEIKAMLGEPTWKPKKAPDAVTWIYDLGMGSRGLGWAFHSIAINFQSNRVVSARHDIVPD